MSLLRIARVAAVLALSLGCGRGATPARHDAQMPPGASPRWNEPPKASPSPASRGGWPEAGTEQRASRGAEDQALARERPGLGTGWGDSRQSHVTDAPFDRRSFDTPWATSRLYYDDADGVRAMTRGASLSSYGVSSISIGGGALSVRLVDAWGSPLPTYDLGSRQYVTGRHGDRYVIQVQNHTGQRFEAVASVDGLDVIDGRAGSLRKRGYLIGPYSSLEIEGFRQSLHEVAEFRFGTVSSSYAARTGSDRNVGVIGVAFFDERGAVAPWFEREAERRHHADPFPGRFAPAPE